MTKNAFRSFAVLPAAGRSRRMGAPKLLLPWQGRPLIEHVVDVWLRSRVDKIFVVVAPDDEPLIAACRQLDCHLVVPSQPPPEMKDSICCALEFIGQHCFPADSDAWLVAPADLPALRPEVISAVLNSYQPKQDAVMVPTHGGRRGHPVLFPWRMARDVFELTEAESLKDLVNRSTVREVLLADAAGFDDLDTPQDYQRLLDRRLRKSDNA